MKQTKLNTVKRPKRAAPLHTRASVRAGRPLHKRALVHPFTVMVLLCVGVLIAGTVARSLAASYTVTATVPAPLPATPATIATPFASQHLVTNLTLVKGACPPQSYVKVSTNGLMGGVAQCTANAYQVQTSLVGGANQLSAQVYSLTDAPGPPGTPLTVYYDEVTGSTTPTDTPVTVTGQPPVVPASVPAALSVTNVERGGYRHGQTPRTSTNPTVSGYAPPLAKMTVTFHSDPETCLTQADDTGYWRCTLDRSLPAGEHHVDVLALTTSGQTLTFPTFQITVDPTIPDILAAPGADPLVLRSDYRYQVYAGHQSVDLNIGVTGGTLPYSITTDWGDGTTTKLTRTDTSPFTTSHTYGTPSGANKNYAVLVRATDAAHAVSVVQLSAVIKGDGIALLASNTAAGGLLDTMHHWLPLIVPAYIVVVLMAIGYYLGEREEYRLLASQKRRAHAGKGK
ncbi:MAG TPA: hypothetical protein VLF71_03190 [Candidatus Saccharimonadales bacterium]|nr:hypothetical protein [Candidatus Saccharimonadales bacterium]